jgi:hypothetical protein
MSADQYGLLRDVVMGVVTVLVFLWGRDRKQTADAIETRFHTLEAKFTREVVVLSQQVEMLQRTIDKGNTRSSEQGNKVLVMVDAIRERLTRLEATRRVSQREIT